MRQTGVNREAAISASVRLAYSRPGLSPTHATCKQVSELEVNRLEDRRCQVQVEVGRRQPAQRPTIAQDGAFLNKLMPGGLALAGDLATHAHMLVNRLTRLCLSVKG